MALLPSLVSLAPAPQGLYALTRYHGETSLSVELVSFFGVIDDEEEGGICVPVSIIGCTGDAKVICPDMGELPERWGNDYASVFVAFVWDKKPSDLITDDNHTYTWDTLPLPLRRQLPYGHPYHSPTLTPEN